MALFHFSVTQVRRGAGQSVIASAAYRAGEKLYSEYYGETNDYTRKRRRHSHRDPAAAACPGQLSRPCNTLEHR